MDEINQIAFTLVSFNIFNWDKIGSLADKKSISLARKNLYV
jgi:hypothetical protein